MGRPAADSARRYAADPDQDFFPARTPADSDRQGISIYLRICLSTSACLTCDHSTMQPMHPSCKQPTTFS
jgi:hypothetical protein